MKLRRLTVGMLSCLMAFAVATPASAQTEEVQFRKERVYFHCADDLAVSNVSSYLGSVPGWDTSPPNQRLSQGGGCFSAETAVRNQPGISGLDTQWRGWFTGNVRSLTIHLHEVSHEATATGGTVELIVRLIVDGKERLVSSATKIPALDAPLEVGGQPVNGAAHTVTFSVTGLVIEDMPGTGTVQHEYFLEIRTTTDSNNVWGYDAVEFDAGITFNPTKLAPVTFKAVKHIDGPPGGPIDSQA